MRFTKDPAKAEWNQRCHLISFETTADIFDDPNHVGETTTSSRAIVSSHIMFVEDIRAGSTKFSVSA